MAVEGHPLAKNGSNLEHRTTGNVYLSVIIPILDEVENIPDLHRELMAALEAINRSFEVIYVDDGSTDGSYLQLEHLAHSDSRVRAIQFRRNFGQTAALAAGIHMSSGEVVMLMDGDMQNDPADIPAFLSAIGSGHDVVSGWRVNRQDSFLTRTLPSRIANWVIGRVTGVRLHDFGCTMKAYSREVIQQVNLYGEMHRFIPAYAFHVGASVTEIPVNHRPRTRGRSKYGLGRTFRVLLDLLVVKFLGTYSTKPIYVFGGLGALAFSGSVIVLAVLVWGKIFQGWYFIQSPLLLLTSMLMVIAVQLVLMGLLAELITRTYHESQHKPIYHVRQFAAYDDGDAGP